MEKVAEFSTGTKKNALYLYFGLGFFVLLALFSLYKWVFLSIRQPTELFFSLAFAAVLFERIKTKCAYEAYDNHLRITKYGMFGTKDFVIPYKVVLGVYIYKPQLLSVVSYRHTHRLHSALDGKKVWTLAYKTKIKSDKVENNRIFFKPSEEMLQFLESKLPQKICQDPKMVH